jgi:hypothetical protein
MYVKDLKNFAELKDYNLDILQILLVMVQIGGGQ